MADVSPLTRDVATEGSLLIPKTIYNTLVEAVRKKLLDRSLACIYVGPAGIPGSSLDIDLVEPDSMKVFRVGEGTVIPMDAPAYSSLNFKPVKYAVRPLVTKEMMEDGKWDMLSHAIRTAGIEMAENENDLIETALGNAANTVAGGASITIPNITRAMQYLEASDHKPTDLIVGVEVLNDLRNIQTFIRANEFGSREVLQTGFVGTLFGMKVWYVGSTWTATTAYVIDRNHAFAIVEKRPVSVNRYNSLENDMVGATITTRIKVNYIRTAATCKITTT